MQILPQKGKQFARSVGADGIAQLLDQSVVTSFRFKVEPQRAKREYKLWGLTAAA